MSLSENHRQIIGQVFSWGYELFDSPEKFNQWLTTPIMSLSDKTPLSGMKTEKGAQQVLDTLTRLERGVYS